MAGTCRNADAGDTFNTAVYCAQGRYGNNNDNGGHWELAVNSTTAQYTWDVDSTFDPVRDVELAVDGSTSDSIADWTVGDEVVSRPGAGYNQIQKVGIRAEVTGSGSAYTLEVIWNSLTVAFYNNVGTQDTPPANPCLPHAVYPIVAKATNADTKIYAPSPGFTPTRVTVQGNVTMVAGGSLPSPIGPSQLVFKIYVWTT